MVGVGDGGRRRYKGEREPSRQCAPGWSTVQPAMYYVRSLPATWLRGSAYLYAMCRKPKKKKNRGKNMDEVYTLTSVQLVNDMQEGRKEEGQEGKEGQERLCVI